MSDNYLYAVIQCLTRDKRSQSATKLTTVELRDPITQQKYIDRGFRYIRRLHYNYNHILREPTNGCYVEISKVRDIGSIHIQSPAAKKLIARLSYF